MKIQYQKIQFQKKTRDVIKIANSIIDEYKDKGYELTVRQVYYQFVARGFVPNNLDSYSFIGTALNKGRMNGDIDWDMIVDRTRSIYQNTHWNSPKEILQAAMNSYKRDLRENQVFYVEVWIEKNALLNVIEATCRELDVLFLPCIGYYSVSAMWRAAQRLKGHSKPVILHLGDHDPSGLDMTEDIRRRLKEFGCAHVKVSRIALTVSQIKQYNPPPNPTKLGDSRARAYIQKYGYDSWELDALSPEVLVSLIREAVGMLTDIPTQKRILRQQEKEAQQLMDLVCEMDED